MTYTVGIDLGTTYTAAAVSRDGRTEIFQLGSRAASIPSVVLLRADGEVLTGEAAERRAATEPTRVAREFKRRLGDPVPLLLGGTPYSAESLSSHLLRAVLQQIAEREGEPPERVVVTHPATYGQYKLDLLQQTCRQADISAVTLLSEPEAAALHYASQERVEPGTVIAVYDFGGGTFDAAVLQKTESGFRQLGQPEGIERLGGIDFDQAVFAHVLEGLEVNLQAVDQVPGGRTALVRIREQCQDAKEALSADTEAAIPVMLPNLQTEIRITRSEFEAMIRPRIEETIRALERTVRSAGIELSGVDRILLVGGSSRIPLVAHEVASRTGRPVVVDAHPKHVIALGAAMLPGSAVQRVAGTADLPPAVSVAPPEPVPAAPSGREIRSDSAASNSAPGRAPTASRSAPVPAAEATEAHVGSRNSRRRVFGIGAAVVAGVVVLGALAFAVLGGGGEAKAAAEIRSVARQGEWYAVSFSTKGFTPSSTGSFVAFYWEGADPVATGVPYWGASPFTDIAVGSAPAGSTRICVVVVDADGLIDTGSRSCRGVG